MIYGTGWYLVLLAIVVVGTALGIVAVGILRGRP